MSHSWIPDWTQELSLINTKKLAIKVFNKVNTTPTCGCLSAGTSCFSHGACFAECSHWGCFFLVIIMTTCVCPHIGVCLPASVFSCCQARRVFLSCIHHTQREVNLYSGRSTFNRRTHTECTRKYAHARACTHQLQTQGGKRTKVWAVEWREGVRQEIKWHGAWEETGQPCCSCCCSLAKWGSKRYFSHVAPVQLLCSRLQSQAFDFNGRFSYMVWLSCS